MKVLPSKAKVVVIGAGIVGNSMVYHLARLGWKEIVQIDKGPLPNPVAQPDTHQILFFRPTTRRK